MSYRPYNAIIAAASNSTATVYPLTNGSGSPIPGLTPVTLNAAGDLDTIDVSNEADALRTVGVTNASILNASSGDVTALGKISNVVGFALDDIIYVSKTGTLTATVPDIGVGDFVSGDFVIQIGKIAKNQTNPSNMDLLVQIQVIGQL